MNNNTNGNNQKLRVRVTLEPTLEEQVKLMSPSKRRQLAAVYERWAHQLRVSAAILDLEKKSQQPSPRRSLKPLPRRRQLLN